MGFAAHHALRPPRRVPKRSRTLVNNIDSDQVFAGSAVRQQTLQLGGASANRNGSAGAKLRDVQVWVRKKVVPWRGSRSERMAGRFPPARGRPTSEDIPLD